jgi:hypothetical protein
MNETPADNAQILADPQRFNQAYARAKALFRNFEGVAGVGFGLKETGGQFTDDIGIVVYVREKRREEDVPPEQRIPPTFEGYRTDVRVVRETTDLVCNNTQEYDRIQGGIQIMSAIGPGPDDRSLGTLGCIVRKRNDTSRENVYLLTCKHVLFTPWVGADGYAYHPFAPGEPGPSHALGPVQSPGFKGNVPVRVPDPANPGQFIVEDFYVDCAIARIDIDSKCFSGSTCTHDTIKYDEAITDLQVNGANTIADVRDVSRDPSIICTEDNPCRVFKVGRTTGRTKGYVTQVNGSFPAARDANIPDSVPIEASNGIEIWFDWNSTSDGLNCMGVNSFAEQGDSGAVVFDEQGRAIGLVCSIPDVRNPMTPRGVHACHIKPVLDSLNICIGSAGTSHGSSHATDGSGVAPAVVAAQDAAPAGHIAFASGRSEIVPGLTAPRPVSEEEARHMRELLAAFRETRLGPALHAAFAEVRREIGYLVRNSRPVKLAWHRHKGPAFLAHVLNHVAGETDRVPHAIDGVTRGALLVRMREALAAHGSNPLRQALARHGDDLLAMLTRADCHGVADCLAWLREKEPA